jgi:hypothetical protein
MKLFDIHQNHQQQIKKIHHAELIEREAMLQHVDYNIIIYRFIFYLIKI